MALSTGARLGPYEVKALVGAGGMGEVYLGRDTRLDRTVAIKVIRTEYGTDPAARQRFDREARAISSLSHPNICQLYDVGHQDGIDYLVMEYLQGETLADRLARGPLGLDQALRIGADIANALETAHREGIVHRDLKPANIMLAKGSAKLMDFGLAKSAAHPSDSGDYTRSVAPLTGDRTIVGTLAYMAPEQLEHNQATTASDVFSFGCVLYEMVSGQRPFSGRSQISIANAILESEPEELSKVQPATPAALERIVHACLVKRPEDRWHSAHDLKLELKWLAEHGERKQAARVHSFLPWALAAIFALTAAVLVTMQLLRAPEPSPVLRATLMPPPGYSFAPYNFAVAPDGTRLAFVTVAQDSQSSLWVQMLSSTVPQQLSGTEGAQYPFWAPDSSRLGFFSQGKLKTADLNASEVRVLCESELPVGASWSVNDDIVFAPAVSGVLYRVRAKGGTPQPVTTLPREGSGQAHRWPNFLPDGTHFLYFADWSGPDDRAGNGLYVGSLEGGDPKLISPDITGNVEYANGYLLYFRDRAITAQPFDLRSMVLSGSPNVITEQGVERHVALSRAGFSSSPSGILLFQSAAESRARLTWFDVSGKELEQLAGAGNRDPRLSPDGRYLAVSADVAGSGRTDIRVYDLAREVNTVLAFGGQDEFPVWSPDGKLIYYASHDGRTFSIKRVAADGSGQPETWLQGPKLIPNDFTRDGRYFAVMNLSLGGAMIDVYSVPERKRVQQFQGAEAGFSPDGLWVAYTARNHELVTQAFPGPGPRIQISSGGGAQPRWSKDSTRLYYVAPDRRLMAVGFDPSGKRPPGPPQAVMQTRITGSHFVFIQYDVAPDGKTFLINSLPPGSGSPIALISNWTAALSR